MTTLSQRYKQKDKIGSDMTTKKTYMVPIGEIFLEEGSNIRSVDQEHAEYMRDCWIDGSDLPPLSVEVTEKGIKVIDGQHRFIGAQLAIAMGHSIPRIECKDFVGTELDKLAHMAKSSQGKPITPIQRAGAYNRARNQGHTSAEIAKAFGRSVADVESHLQLLSSGEVLIGMVESGEVAASTAVALSREHGPKAASVAAEGLAKAKAAGKSKLTKSAAMQQFSARKARRLVELLVDSEFHRDGDGDHLLLYMDTSEEINSILAEYRSGISTNADGGES
ncbi:DNA-binding protein [Erwinia sp. Leaf53]|uniref:ParB/RepB/Spo0J family partition protein n=1 Tax=Erwinia sp. Leaf53 TaxID=1736225 RepID=UPI0006F94DA2|nr:DNA-binding protein [Erwinia sp. Leaf53]KQN53185.1 DNA-binding protein [Erwinia sp. Leaf53]